MPNLPSAAKRMRQSARRRERNKRADSELENLSLKLYSLAKSDRAAAQKLLPAVIRKYTRAAHVGVIPRQRASRKVSRFMRLLAKA